MSISLGSGGESCILQDVTGGIDEPDPKDREELKGRGVVPREGVHEGSLAPGTERSELMAGLRTCSSHGEVNASHRKPHQNSPRLLQSFAQTLLPCRGCGGLGQGAVLDYLKLQPPSPSPAAPHSPPCFIFLHITSNLQR